MSVKVNITTEQVRAAYEKYKAGATFSELARKHKVSTKTMERYLKALPEWRPPPANRQGRRDARRSVQLDNPAVCLICDQPLLGHPIVDNPCRDMERRFA